MLNYSRSIVVAALSASCVVLGCRNPSPAPMAVALPSDGIAPSELNNPDYLDVAEAVFRYQFDHNASGRQRNADYFFLTLAEGDPPQELLERFATEKPPVLPKSLSIYSHREGHKHWELEGRGLGFRISSIKWLDANTAEVKGGYLEGGTSASGNVYRVERRDGKWSVTNDDTIWIA